MLAALATTLARESRTSLGDPVEPEVDSSSARSGCRSVGAGVRRGDLAVPGLLVGSEQHHRAPGRERPEEPDHRVEVGAHAQQHHASVGAEALGFGCDRGREHAVGDATGAVDQRHGPRGSTEQVVDEAGTAYRDRDGGHRCSSAKTTTVADDLEPYGGPGTGHDPRRRTRGHPVLGLEHDADRGVVAEEADIGDLGEDALGVLGQHLHLLPTDGDQDQAGLAGSAHGQHAERALAPCRRGSPSP